MRRFLYMLPTIGNILLVVFSVLLFAGSIALFILEHHKPISYQTPLYRESTAVLSNPYIGLYQIHGYTLTDEDASNASKWLSNTVVKDTNQLVLLEINLVNYRSSAISKAALKQLDTILSYCSRNEKQMILRFLYDWDGKGPASEPDTKEQIIAHMDAVIPIVNQYAEHVYILQGNFTGSYGEMASTNYKDTSSFTMLNTHLAELTDPGIFLATRTPAQWRTVCSMSTPLTSELASYDALPSRISLFNDGMLGSKTDTGTYTTTSRKGNSDFTVRGTREEELAFQNQLCQFVPNGGEVITDNFYNDTKNAMLDLKTMHVSYLNEVYDSKVLDKWKKTEYISNDLFNGISGYDYIVSHLGYRYVLTDSDIFFHELADKKATLSFSIENHGYAPAYRDFEAKIILRSRSTGLSYTVPIDFQATDFLAGDTLSINTPIDVRKMREGAYHIILNITDPATKQTIQFANTSLNTKDGILLGTLTIE